MYINPVNGKIGKELKHVSSRQARNCSHPSNNTLQKQHYAVAPYRTTDSSTAHTQFYQQHSLRNTLQVNGQRHQHTYSKTHTSSSAYTGWHKLRPTQGAIVIQWCPGLPCRHPLCKRQTLQLKMLLCKLGLPVLGKGNRWLLWARCLASFRKRSII